MMTLSNTILMLVSPILLAVPPVPRDLQLPLPLNSGDLQVIIVALFLLHILFVNMMVGGSVLAVFFEILGLVVPKYDALAKRIAVTITVNKSLAVVLGVGPLLAINLLYTTHFYSANALTGYAWIAIVPLVIITFLLTYVHKYTWDAWTGPKKGRHIAVGVISAFLFLCIPLIFLSNINLMLFPDKWEQVRGFFTSLEIGNVFPRYFHFMSASIAVTSLFLAGWFGRKKFPVDSALPGFTHAGLRRVFYKVAFFFSLAQVVFGPLVLLTLPHGGINNTLLVVILSGVAVAGVALVVMWVEVRSSDAHIGRAYPWVWVLLGVVVIFMATGRHVYRENSLAPHKQMIADRTATFHSIELATQMRINAGLGAGGALATGPTGESVFKNCAACHAIDNVLAAPSVREVAALYAGNPGGIVTWAKAPGKKRAEFAPMPSFAHLGDEQLELVAEYMLELGGPETGGAEPDGAAQ